MQRGWGMDILLEDAFDVAIIYIGLSKSDRDSESDSESLELTCRLRRSSIFVPVFMLIARNGSRFDVLR